MENPSGEDTSSSSKSKKRNLLRWIYKRYLEFQISLSPQQNLFYGFLLYTLLGWGLLSLPWAQSQSVSVIDNLFSSASAISTTGLATLSVADSYTFFGELVILLLIQVGGIGYMTITSIIILANRRGLTHFHKRILGAEFPMAENFALKDFLKSILYFTLIMEALGAVALYLVFVSTGESGGAAVWSAIFHSISAFCTAGFSLYNTSFENYASNDYLNSIICVLALAGSLGFIVVTDVWNRLRGKSKALTFTTKIIFVIFGILLFAGTLFILLFEPSIQSFAFGERCIVAFFQSMTALTTVGFNTIPIGQMAGPVLLLILFLMYVGASPSGTGGGMKSTTLSAILAIMWSRLRANSRVTFAGKEIPTERLYLATSTFIFYTLLLFFITFSMSLLEDFGLQELLFETASALGTVGLSMGITGNLSSLGKLLLVITMFIGRLGVITFGLALMGRKAGSHKLREVQDLAV